MNTIIGTSGFTFDKWHEDGIFYPANIENSTEEQMKYYASVFNCIELDIAVDEDPEPHEYQAYVDYTQENPNFQFFILVNNSLTHNNKVKNHKKHWDLFWNGYNNNGGCDILERNNKLGGVIFEFPTSFKFTRANLGRLTSFSEFLPGTTRCIFEFHDSFWWRSKATQRLFKKNPNWSFSVPYIENHICNAGWAGNLASTNVYTKDLNVPVPITNFLYFRLFGTLGCTIGSYDDNNFLEKLRDLFITYKNSEIVCIFCNACSTYCYPLPNINGICPMFHDLPDDVEYDRPCCLHDSLKLKKLIQNLSPYDYDSDGYVKLKFVNDEKSNP